MNNKLVKKEQLQQTVYVISLRDLLEILLLRIRVVSFFFLIFLIVGILYAGFRTPVFQSQALLKVSKSSNGSALLSQIPSISNIIAGSANQEVSAQQYILGSFAALESAVSKYHLDIVVTPWHFPLLGTAMANHYDNNPKHLGLGPVKPLWGLSRYSWGGDRVVVDQFIVPQWLQGKTFTLKYLGENQYQLTRHGKIILTGVIGQVASVDSGINTITLLISKITAYPNTHFTIQKLALVPAIKRLHKMIAVYPAGRRTNLIAMQIHGEPREHLPYILNSIINNVIALNIQSHAEKAEKVLQFVNTQLPKLRSQLSQTNAKISILLPMGSQFAAAEQQKNIQNMVYTNMLLDVARYNLQESSSLGDLTVLIQPTPIFRNGISAPIIALLITLLGLIFGVVFIFSRHYLLGVVHDPQQIEDTTGLQLLSSLQPFKPQTQQLALFKRKRIPYLKLISELASNAAVLEGFRGLRTSLLLNYFSNARTDKNNIITINGAIPNIGKSFISANLAQQFADIGKRVLLIDADLRKGTIAHYFDPIGIQGFVDLLKGCDVNSCVLKTRFNNLDVIASGKLDGKNAELLSVKNLERVFSALSPQYDLIVVDTPPILLVSDALAICRCASVNIITFAYGKHNQREIDIAISQFEKSHILLHGFVMNFMPSPKLGYGYAYGYGYEKA